MPKIKLPTKSPHIDMTPMVDLFSVLLIFLMLTATMRQPEPAPVDTPFSSSEKPTPDFNLMTFLISADGKVFLNIDNGPDTLLAFRPKILTEIGKRYGIEFTASELREFERYPSSVGLPIQDMKEFLNIKGGKERMEFQKGIPIDSADNQLAMWILYSRQVNPNVRAVLKGDSDTKIDVIQKVLSILQDYNVRQFSLVTNLEAAKINLAEIQN